MTEMAPVYRLDDYRSALPPQPAVNAEEVWAEVMAAAALFGTLRDAGLGLRFDAGEPGEPPRVRLTDLEGHTIREVPPALACDPAALEAELVNRAG
jgi:hypothetical protein